MAVSKFPVEAGAILLFARAVGETNPSIPILSTRPSRRSAESSRLRRSCSRARSSIRTTRFALSRARRGSAPDATRPESRRQAVRAGAPDREAAVSTRSRSSRYHRHLRPGDVLSATGRQGERWEKQGRSGKLVFSESITEYRDQNGDLVVTARSVGVRTERPALGRDLLMSLAASTLAVGDHREEVLVDDLSRTQIVQYAGASGDYNPLHSDEVFATKVAGYPGVFSHGMLTMGITARILTDWVGDGRLLRYGVRFVKQVWPGDSLTARAEVTAIRETQEGPVADFDVTTKSQDGDVVLTGSATARLDP